MARPVVPLRAASTNSVASAARCSAPTLMVSTQRSSRSPSSDVASSELIARMPVSGVRTSCANAASAASTIPASDGERAARGLPTAGLATAFLAARFFGAGFLTTRFLPARAARKVPFRLGDLAAMIPQPIRTDHAMAEAAESRHGAFRIQGFRQGGAHPQASIRQRAIP